MNRSDHLHTPSDTPTFSWRLRLALLVSVAIHALLLSIPLEGDVFGMPGLRLPWQERRLTASDLQVVLAPAPVTVPRAVPDPAPAAPEPAPPAPPVTPTAGLTALPPAVTKTEQGGAVSAPRQPVAPAPAAPAPVVTPSITEAVPVPAPQLDDAQQRQPEAAASARIIALDKARQDQVIRDERAREEVAQRIAAQADAARLAQARLAQQAAEEQQRQADLRREAQRQEQAATEAQAQARELAAREERSRADAAQREAERVDAQRREQLARAEAAQREAARVEADRQAQALQALQAQLAQQAKLDTARQEAAKQESARQDAAKAEAARQAQLQQEQAGQAKSAQEAQREERLRAIGRQMKQEAAQRDAAASLPGMPPPAVHGQRRGWLLGRADPNTELVTYAQAMGRKIELNMTFDTVRDAVKQPHRQPVVTVAVRSDGSVERVTFVTSSGVPAIDEAIRQIVASQAPYGPFPPALARQYDVVEIRRTWIFDMAVRLE